MTGTYSSRQIAKQCRENVNVMWLTAFQKPDFRTINTFRSEKLKDSIEEIFVSTVKLLNRKGYVSMETVETVTEMEDGSIVTITTCPVYEEVEDGLIIKIGQYSIIDTKSDVRYEGLEDIEYFDSLDEIPELSQDEYDQLVDAGNAVTIENFPLGNPADPSSTETIIELYDDIEINVIDDSVFKLIMEL